MTAMIKSDKGAWEDRSVEVLHKASVSHYARIGLYVFATAHKQKVYAFGEAGEMSVDGVLKNDLEEIKDGIGDVMICVINWAHLSHVDFVRAYDLMMVTKASEDTEATCLEVGSAIINLCSRESVTILLERLDCIGKAYDLTLAECLGHSYDVVFNRKVKPLNGTLVKEADWGKYPDLEGVAVL